MQLEEQEEDAMAEEDGKMDVDEEADSRITLEIRKRNIVGLILCTIAISVWAF